MSRSRREFLAGSSATLMAAFVASQTQAQPPAPGTPSEQQQTVPGAPPTFGTAPAVGPAVSPATFEQAEKLVQVEMTAAERAQAAGSWRQALASVYERRTGPRKVALEEMVPPATVWNPILPGMRVGPGSERFVPTANAPAMPHRDEDIAFAPVSSLSSWIRTKQITSERLTQIYLERLKRFDPKLRCVITLTEEHALNQARAADREIAAGHYRGPLHGIAWGAKDLLDTTGIPTTYGAEPYRN